MSNVVRPKIIKKFAGQHCIKCRLHKNQNQNQNQNLQNLQNQIQNSQPARIKAALKKAEEKRQADVKEAQAQAAESGEEGDSEVNKQIGGGGWGEGSLIF